MDYMLYIIAGLVIILIIGAWVLRKNKAQQPRAQTVNKDRENAATSTITTDQATPTRLTTGNVASSATKFDNLTVAQRFIDQQRYDKAIESLERGLNEKPNDSELSLKLLNVYALTNQKEDFYNTYASIKAHSDPVTVEQAQQLKDLLDAEQAPESFGKVTDTNMTLDSETPLFNTKQITPTTDIDIDNMSLDFDIPTPATDPEPISTTTTSLSNDNSINNNNDAFELTLDDLETADLETTDLEQGSLKDSSTETTNRTTTESDTKAPVLNTDNVNYNSIDKDSDDFTLDLDVLSNDSSGDFTEDSEKNELTLSDDDFVLDFDDLAEETDADSDKRPATTPASSESIDDDFTLFIDEADQDTVSADTATASAPTTQDSSQDLSLESDILENSVNDTLTPLDTSNVIDTDTDTDETKLTPTLSDNTVTFDDDTGIDDFDFVVDVDATDASPTTIMPVTTASDSMNLDSKDDDTLPTADFAAQFAADFDFVKNLDNNQVTLDLAGQYLQLGEYDSAKRLLNEVVTQGNSDQQSQAQELLARTA